MIHNLFAGVYSVTNAGVVARTDTGRVLNQTATLKGYLRVHLTRNGERRKYSVHRLVAAEFLGLDLDNPTIQVDHIDGNKANNHVGNLRLLTNLDNILAACGRLGVDNQTVKICAKCLEVKPKIAFNIMRQVSDGYHSWCRACVSNYNKTYSGGMR